MDDDTAASQDCPSLTISSLQSEGSIDLFEALASIQGDLLEEASDVGAFLPCTSFSDQLYGDAAPVSFGRCQCVSPVYCGG